VEGGYETVDEALSLSTVLLGAAAAGVVVSLWAVNDFAPLLLMRRFYEELVATATPAHALRVAMPSVRDLSLGPPERPPALRANGELATVGRSDEERPRRALPVGRFVLSGA
jgi:CHAT domain-containing protein